MAPNRGIIVPKRIIIDERAESGEVQTIATTYVWKCKTVPSGEGEWSLLPPIKTKNTLMHACNPENDYCIGEIDKKTTEWHLLDPFTPKEHEGTYKLDLASGSRNHGRFTFAKEETGHLYYGQKSEEQWKRIIYGSIIHTPCKRLVYKRVRVIISNDEGVDENGNPLDDPTTGKHWKTGDSHAKCNRAFIELLALQENEINPEKPIQFRAAVWKRFVAKGTIAWNPDLDSTDIDLVIPQSCLKGNKPKLGRYKDKILMGVVFEAEVRDRAKPGWMLWQWFPWEVLEADGIISNLKSKCNELAGAVNDIVALADILRINQDEDEAEQTDGEILDSEAMYENPMLRIIKADKKGILLLHPYIVRRVKDRLQKMWKNLATAAGVRFYSVLCQPDESLAGYPDGTIDGEKVFCAPDFDPGEYIVFCNPMRHWGDVQLWRNSHEGTYKKAFGVLAASRKLLLSLGRDTDGDFIQLINSSKYPNMADTIRKFSGTPAVEKLPKVPLDGNLQEIAIRSMNDMTGVVAKLLARARTARAENVILFIPKGPGQKQGRQMRIIDFLSQQLQIAVDSIKSAYPNNTNGLNTVTKYLNGQIDKNGNVIRPSTEVPWLGDLKTEECYKERPCKVSETDEDTISRFVRLVNSYWKKSALRWEGIAPEPYRTVLFKNLPYDPAQYSYAKEHLQKYRKDIKAAIDYKDQTGDDRIIKEVSEYNRAQRDILLQMEKSPGQLYSPVSWASAYWNVCHEAKSGDAGLVFTMFTDEIIERLGVESENKPQAKVVEIYAVQYTVWSKDRPGYRWTGEQVQVRFLYKTVQGVNRLAAEMLLPTAVTVTGWHYLGLVSAAHITRVSAGETREYKVYTSKPKPDNPARYYSRDFTQSVALFDLSMTDEQITSWLIPGSDMSLDELIGGL